MNSVSLIGRVGANPEKKITESGKSVCSFNLAVKGRNNTTNWIRVVFWNKAAELIAKYVTKGDQLGVTGELVVREYEKNDEKRSIYEVNVNDITFIGNKKNDNASSSTDESIDIAIDDDLPF